MNALVCVSVLLCLICSKAWVLPEKNSLFRLDIVHYNDFHDRFEETSVSYPVCTTNDTSCLGGFARLFYEIQYLMREKPGSLLLNAGDSFQGTYWYSLLKWNVTQRFMNLLPHDAFAIGNHEFDDGVAGLAPYLAALKAPVVAANMDSRNVPSMQGLYKPHIVVERDGRKIGIIGLITPETGYTSSADGVIFTDPARAAQREAMALVEKDIDIVIVLSHCGLDVDKDIAYNYGENIDIIVGGHSHSLLWNGTSPSGEEIIGPYPVLVESKVKPGHQVLIVTASAFTKYIGNLSVWFDDTGDLQSYEGTPVFLNRSIPEDEHVKALLRPYAEKLHLFVEEVVGEAADDLLVKTCGYRECALGNAVTDSMLDVAKERVNSTLPQLAFILRNNLRGSLSKGLIKRGEVINTLPFMNKIETFNIKGRYIWEAFDHCLTKSWQENPYTGPWMPQVAGIQLTYNTTEKLGKRVKSIIIKDGDEYKPLQFDGNYTVTTYDFISGGGNEFYMLKENKYNSKKVGVDAKVFESYVKRNTPINPVLDGRITVLT